MGRRMTHWTSKVFGGKVKKVEIDGYVFDSLAEGRRYAELRTLTRTGTIRSLAVHPSWDITVSGMHVCRYAADFKYEVPDWPIGTRAPNPANSRLVVEDVKGFVVDREFKLKAKLMKAVYGIDVVIIGGPGKSTPKKAGLAGVLKRKGYRLLGGTRP
jgi:Protein of unknown function (DUF1064)